LAIWLDFFFFLLFFPPLPLFFLGFCRPPFVISDFSASAHMPLLAGRDGMKDFLFMCMSSPQSQRLAATPTATATAAAPPASCALRCEKVLRSRHRQRTPLPAAPPPLPHQSRTHTLKRMDYGEPFAPFSRSHLHTRSLSLSSSLKSSLKSRRRRRVLSLFLMSRFLGCVRVYAGVPASPRVHVCVCVLANWDDDDSSSSNNNKKDNQNSAGGYNSRCTATKTE